MDTADVEGRLATMRESLELTREVLEMKEESGSVPIAPVVSVADDNWRVGVLLLRLGRPEAAKTRFRDTIPHIVHIFDSVETKSKWRTAVVRGTRHWCCAILSCSESDRERVAQAILAFSDEYLPPGHSSAARYHLSKGLAAFLIDEDDRMMSHFEQIERNDDAYTWDRFTADGIVAIRNGDGSALADAIDTLLADHKQRRADYNGNLTTASWLVDHRVAILLVLADEYGLDVHVEDEFVPDCIASGGYCDR